jgi:hypothetical protein
MKRTISFKWITVAISILLIIGPTACFFIEECPKALPYFEIQGLRISNATFTGQGLNPWRLAENNESIKYDSFFMKVSFERTYYSNLSSSSGQYLYALSCVENGDLGSQVGVDTIYLVTLQDYNSQYSQNDTLNNIVSTNDWTYRVDDFTNFFSLTNYIEANKDSILRSGFELKITEPPSDVSNAYSFKLIFILQTGDRFETTSDKIELTK